MFVEIVRLFIVFLATAAGFTLGSGGPLVAAAGAPPGSGPIIGATLGACVGYVAGGVVGRLLGLVMGALEERVERTHPGRLLAGAIGAVAVGGLGALVAIPAAVLLPGLWGWPVFGLVVWLGISLGYGLAARKYEDLLALAGLSTRPLVRAEPFGVDPDASLVDTSAVIDGRLLAVSRAGFLRGALLIPRFVLDEVQAIADAADPTRRRRGRRGLDVLEALRSGGTTEVHVLDDEVPEHDEVDAKLVALARRLRVNLLTVDEPLQRVAELQGIRCLNLGRLSDGLRPVHITGEVVRVPITREGREPGQGIGFLDDGTMVVVGESAHLVGRDVDVRITGNARTALGTMLFGTVSAV